MQPGHDLWVIAVTLLYCLHHGESQEGEGKFFFYFFFFFIKKDILLTLGGDFIVCFTSYFVVSMDVLPHSPGVVYYHVLLILFYLPWAGILLYVLTVTSCSAWLFFHTVLG